MRYAKLLIPIYLCFSCTGTSKHNTIISKKSDSVSSIPKVQKDTPIPSILLKKSNYFNPSQIPSNGSYIYDIAFAEWNGSSMGMTVTVIIKGDSVKIINNNTHLTLSKKGDTIDHGKLIKHKSGVWIIAKSKADQTAEVGGCSGGPAVIDFKNKKYWMC